MTDEQKTAARPIHCSFCGKSEAEVIALIAGPAVLICNECSILTLDIMLDKINNETVKEFARNELELRALSSLPRMTEEEMRELISGVSLNEGMNENGIPTTLRFSAVGATKVARALIAKLPHIATPPTIEADHE